MRAWVLALLALVLLPLVPVEICGCPEDAESERCAPDCNDCVCCAHVPRLLADRPGIGEPGGVVASVDAAPPLRLLSPAPRDVFHVPLA
jgi:hypothetical protein